MLAVHRALAFLIVLLALGGTIWAVHDWLSRRAPHPRLRTATLAVSAVVGAQALVGAVLALQGERPVDGLTHFIVGPLTLLALPAALVAGRGRSELGAAAILAIAWFALLLLALRAVGSGGGLTA